MEFPETILLTINIHGGIQCFPNDLINNPSNYKLNHLENDLIYSTIKIPKNINKLIIINSVPIGIDIHITNSQIVKYTNLISNNYYKCNNNIENMSIEQIILLNKLIIDKIIDDTILNVQKYTNMNEKFIKCVNSKYIYEQHIYSSDDVIVDKSYGFENFDKTNEFKNIQIINKNFENIDLFDLLEKNEYFDGFETTTENILYFLSNKCVKNIIIFDFTCNTFLHEKKMSERTIRNFRREINHKLNF